MASKSELQRTQAQAAGAASTAQAKQAQYAGQAAPGYQTFASTGGITPQETAATKAEVASGLGGLYSSQMQNLQRQRAVQGGYSPGYGANMNQLTRSMGAQTADAINAANLGLLQQTRQGQLAGLGGLQNFAGMYGGQLSPLLSTSAATAAATPSGLDIAGQLMQEIGQGGGPVMMGLGGMGWKPFATAS